MKNNNPKSLKNDERGIVTIIITMLVMLLLTLIVLAMSRNANREQRQALDRQLNSQAFYAAESGINDTRKYINTPGVQDDKDNCDPLPPPYTNVLDNTGPISYTCVLYDKTPPELNKDVSKNQSWITEVKGATSGIDSLTFSWNATEGSGDFDSCINDNAAKHLNVTDFKSQNCNAGYLRVELINPDAPDRQAMIDGDMVVFLAPGDGVSSITRGGNDGVDAGKIYTAQCSNASGKCTATITGIGLANGQRLLMRVKSIYKDNNVTVNGAIVGGGDVQFANSQAMIDSTGKANDVLKRLKVYVPLKDKYYYPEFAVQTLDSICKKLNVIPGNVTDTCNP